jgi:NadR type nicotinamide-nucleotide adenylyltransferase
MMKKIAIIGPESTGKSFLCEQLAFHFKSNWAPEYAREYLLTYGTQYTYENLYTIAHGQIKNEEDAVLQLNASNNKTGTDAPLFMDTDLYVIKVWSEFVFNKCDNRILKMIAARSYDMYLLCNTDLPWVADELREYPDLEIREKLFHYYKDCLVQQHVPWKIISGGYDERLAVAIKAVSAIL